MSLTRAQAAADTIRAAILSGHYLSGERLIELRIAQTLDVSQNTIRDALRILEHEGWVVKQPRRGVHVRSFSAADAAEVGALIAAVEPLALRAALEHPDRSLRPDLRALIASARKYANAGDSAAAFEHLIRFHERISAAARQPLTAQVLDTLYNHLRLIEATRQSRAPRPARDLDARIDDYETLLRLIDAGDSDAALRHLRRLIEATSAATSAALRI